MHSLWLFRRARRGAQDQRGGFRIGPSIADASGSGAQRYLAMAWQQRGPRLHLFTARTIARCGDDTRASWDCASGAHSHASSADARWKQRHCTSALAQHSRRL